MKLTKPAGMVFQIIGGILLVLGLMAVINGTLTGASFSFCLGLWMFWQGGKTARQR
jgi:uncharacterized membrane protein HdeD (DUF308 family)